MIDLYFKNDTDMNFDDEMLDDDTEIGNLTSQIRMLLFTERGEVFGENALGLNLENLIFESNLSQNKILNILNKQAQQYLVYDTKQYDVSFDIQFYKGTVRDIALLQVLVNSKIAIEVFIR